MCQEMKYLTRYLKQGTWKSWEIQVLPKWRQSGEVRAGGWDEVSVGIIVEGEGVIFARTNFWYIICEFGMPVNCINAPLIFMNKF